MSKLSEIKALKEQINLLRTETKKQVEAIFKEAALELFVEYPVLDKIVWAQYTPYFNDGDTCTFGSNHTSPAIYFNTDIQSEDDDDDWYDWYDHEYSKGSLTREWDNKQRKYVTIEVIPEIQVKATAGDAVVDFLSNFDNDDVYNLFGDHQLITITKDGIDASDYSHD